MSDLRSQACPPASPLQAHAVQCTERKVSYDFERLCRRWLSFDCRSLGIDKLFDHHRIPPRWHHRRKRIVGKREGAGHFHSRGSRRKLG